MIALGVLAYSNAAEEVITACGTAENGH